MITRCAINHNQPAAIPLLIIVAPLRRANMRIKGLSCSMPTACTSVCRAITKRVSEREKINPNPSLGTDNRRANRSCALLATSYALYGKKFLNIKSKNPTKSAMPSCDASANFEGIVLVKVRCKNTISAIWDKK